MKVILSKNVDLEQFAVFAELGWLERRSELGMVCRGAEKTGRNRIDYELLVSIIPDVSEMTAQNIISWCKMLKLCDRDGYLLTLGVEVAKSDLVPVPEQGVYDFWMINHPLTRKQLLHAARHSSGSNLHGNALNIPDHFAHRFDEIFHSCVSKNKSFIVRDLTSNSEKSKMVFIGRRKCSLGWIFDFDQGSNSWSLSGNTSKGSLSCNAEEPDVDIWSIMAHWGHDILRFLGEWNQAKRQLEISFRKDFSEQEREHFKMDFESKTLNVHGYGDFDSASFQKVPIMPRTGSDAQKWANARLERVLSKEIIYRSREQVEELFTSLVVDTPLEEKNPFVPSHEELTEKRLTKQPEVFWSLMVPSDLRF